MASANPPNASPRPQRGLGSPSSVSSTCAGPTLAGSTGSALAVATPAGESRNPSRCENVVRVSPVSVAPVSRRRRRARSAGLAGRGRRGRGPGVSPGARLGPLLLLTPVTSLGHRVRLRGAPRTAKCTQRRPARTGPRSCAVGPIRSAAMTRQCARPDCAEHATSTFGYDYRESRVWLVDLTEEPHPSTYDMCRRHAERAERAGRLAAARPADLRAEPRPRGLLIDEAGTATSVGTPAAPFGNAGVTLRLPDLTGFFGLVF